GGLANKTLSKTTRGIPFLEDLPFVGRFFRSNDDRVTDSQWLIFLTPTIVEETGGAQLSPG
ncbi:MAG: type II and III secretion system protein, partial [Armatimonadetes bacterium]|nr:type II and III secretion system protein [Armatimonadota bacterium]